MRRRGMGSVAFAVMAAGLFAGPSFLARSWSSGAPEASESEDDESGRDPERVLEVEGWASEGFAGLAEEVAAMPEAPTWEEVRRLMERRGCTDLRYALTIRFLRRDGLQKDWTLLRRPYAEPQHADEFLRYLRGGPDAAVWDRAGDPPWKSAPGLDSER